MSGNELPQLKQENHARCYSSKMMLCQSALLQPGVSHRSSFQNGGDLDHLGRIAFEQICRIGSHMFFSCLLIKEDHSRRRHNDNFARLSHLSVSPTANAFMLVSFSTAFENKVPVTGPGFLCSQGLLNLENS